MKRPRGRRIEKGKPRGMRFSGTCWELLLLAAAAEDREIMHAYMRSMRGPARSAPASSPRAMAM